jgi:hypothetical protein
MLIHSVTPLEMLIERPEIPAASIKEIPGGYLEGYDTPQGFCMSRLCSTDPMQYLRAEYTPGSIYDVRRGGLAAGHYF